MLRTPGAALALSSFWGSGRHQHVPVLRLVLLNKGKLESCQSAVGGIHSAADFHSALRGCLGFVGNAMGDPGYVGWLQGRLGFAAGHNPYSSAKLLGLIQGKSMIQLSSRGAEPARSSYPRMVRGAGGWEQGAFHTWELSSAGLENVP